MISFFFCFLSVPKKLLYETQPKSTNYHGVRQTRFPERPGLYDRNVIGDGAFFPDPAFITEHVLPGTPPFSVQTNVHSKLVSFKLGFSRMKRMCWSNCPTMNRGDLQFLNSCTRMVSLKSTWLTVKPNSGLWMIVVVP